MRNAGELERENVALRDRLYGLSEANLCISERLNFESVLREVVGSDRVIGVLTVGYARRRVTMTAWRRVRDRSGRRRERGGSVGRGHSHPPCAEGPGRIPQPHLPARRFLDARKTWKACIHAHAPYLSHTLKLDNLPLLCKHVSEHVLHRQSKSTTS